MSKYRKTLVAVVGAVIAWVGLVLTSKSGPVTASEWYSGLVGLATALGVYGLANDGYVPEDDLLDGGTH